MIESQSLMIDKHEKNLSLINSEIEKFLLLETHFKDHFDKTKLKFRKIKKM